MNIFLWTVLSIVVSGALLVGAMLWAPEFWYVMIGAMLFNGVLFLGVLKCPRCGDFTSTWRIPGTGKSLFGAVFLLIPPWRCGTCKLSFFRNGFSEIRNP